MRRKRRRRFLLLCLLGLALAAFALLRSRLQPVIEELARTQMDSVISTLLNDAINDQIAAGEINYDNMIFIEKNLSGELTALRTNMSEVNHLKTEVLSRINVRLEKLQTERIGIPIGSLLLPEFFSGQGPEIPIRLISIGTSSADFENQFEQAGINQTLHRILLTAFVDTTVLVPGGTTTLRVVTEVVVAETILVGTVPQNYVSIDGTDLYQGG